MLKKLRCFSAIFLTGALMLLLASCGGKKVNEAANQLAMTVNGHEISVGAYAANYLYSKATIENLMYQYGVPDLWNSDYGSAYKDQLSEIARNQSAALCLVPDQFNAAGLTLTEDEMAAYTITSTELAEMGFTDDLVDQLEQYSAMLDKLDEYYFGENGVMSPSESEVEAYFHEHYIRAKHILISTRDDSNQPITDEAELAAIERKAQELYQRAAAGEDFDALVKEFGEDPGMEANPDGYQFTSGVMVAEFENAAKALAENQISEPVKSDYGWHIIQRLPLQSEKDVYAEIVTALTGMDMNSLLEQWVNEADIQTEEILSQITFDNVDEYKYTV